MASKDRSLLGDDRRPVLLAIAISFVVLVVLIAIVAYLERPEHLARIELPHGRVVTITAESEFNYDPPGYIYCEVVENGKTIVPERRFMGIGPERKPHGKFSVVQSDEGQLMAILLDGDVQFIYDFATGDSWPGLYTTIDDQNYAFAKKALQRLKVDEREPSCLRIMDYEIRQERKRKQQQR